MPESAMSPILSVHRLVKQYADVCAVDGLSLEIAEGTCFGLLGPNGAGKTTTVEIMEGVVEATSGDVLFRGEPRDRDFKNEVGIQFQSTSLQDFLKVHEVLQLFGSLYPRRADTEELIELCALGDFLDRDHRKLSGGQRQRVMLALALINDPQVVFLDEPTTGLDPQARRNVWELVRRIQGRGKTVLLTTHYMDEAYELCDEIAIMDHGRIIAQGSPRDLLADQFEGAVVSLPLLDFEPDDSFPWSTQVRGDQVEIQADDVNATIARLIEDRVPLDNLNVKSRTLEDLFLELTGKELRA